MYTSNMGVDFTDRFRASSAVITAGTPRDQPGSRKARFLARSTSCLVTAMPRQGRMSATAISPSSTPSTATCNTWPGARTSCVR